jgi:hypothetical protein
MVKLYAVTLKSSDDFYFASLFASSPDDLLYRICEEARTEFDDFRIVDFTEFGSFQCPERIGRIAIKQIDLAGPPRFHKGVTYEEAASCLVEIGKKMQGVLFYLQKLHELGEIPDDDCHTT